MNRVSTPYTDKNGDRIYLGDKIKIGQLKGIYIVVWDEEVNRYRMKWEHSESGFGFGIPKYPIKIVR